MRRVVCLAALLALLGSGRAPLSADDPAPAAPATERADWTLLVYHDADCDLEAPMMDDLDEWDAEDAGDEGGGLWDG